MTLQIYSIPWRCCFWMPCRWTGLDLTHTTAEISALRFLRKERFIPHIKNFTMYLLTLNHVHCFETSSFQQLIDLQRTLTSSKASVAWAFEKIILWVSSNIALRKASYISFPTAENFENVKHLLWNNFLPIFHCCNMLHPHVSPNCSWRVVTLITGNPTIAVSMQLAWSGNGYGHAVENAVQQL